MYSRWMRARDGVVWHYQRPVSSGLLDDAAAHKNRGVAVWEHSVYVETDDAHLLCLDARSGNLLWDVQYADKVKHYGATSAPLVVKDEVIVGTSGGDSGVRGFVAAYDAATGKLKWRLWTIPGPGRIRLLQLAGRFLPAWRRHNLDARYLRSGTRHFVLDNQQRRARFCRRFPAGRRPLHRLRPGNRSRHRKIEMVLPVHASRLV